MHPELWLSAPEPQTSLTTWSLLTNRSTKGAGEDPKMERVPEVVLQLLLRVLMPQLRGGDELLHIRLVLSVPPPQHLVLLSHPPKLKHNRRLPCRSEECISRWCMRNLVPAWGLPTAEYNRVPMTLAVHLE